MKVLRIRVHQTYKDSDQFLVQLDAGIQNQICKALLAKTQVDYHEVSPEVAKLITEQIQYDVSLCKFGEEPITYIVRNIGKIELQVIDCEIEGETLDIMDTCKHC